MSIELNPLAVSVKNCNKITIHPLHPTMHGGGGGISSVVSVVAAVAIPVFAPTIATSLGVSSAISAATGLAAGGVAAGALGGAVVGAGLGAISAVVTGQPIARGALTGGIGGAIGGGIDAFASSQPVLGADGTPQLVDGTTTATGVNLTDPVAVSEAGLTPFGTVPGSPQTAMLRAQEAAFVDPSLADSVRNIGIAALEKVSNDPEAMANLTLKAASRLVGVALVPDEATAGLSPEEEQIVANVEQELREIKARDENVFANKLDIAGRLLAQARGFDPTYTANQYRNASAIQTARAGLAAREQQAFDKPFLTQTTADRNRENIAAFNVGAREFDRGFIAGRDQQNQALNQALGAFEGIGSSGQQTTPYLTGQLGLGNIYAKGREAGDTARANIVADLAGLNTTILGSDDEEDEALA